MINFENQTVAITGGGSGIGAAMALRFAKHGAKVAILELDREKAEQFIQENTQPGFELSCFQVNVADHLAVRSIINEVVSKNGSIDVLINNAGISQIGNLDATTEEDFDKVFEVNVKGVYNCLHAVIGHMKEQQRGVILNIASVAAIVGIPDRFAYSATKGAILSMTMSVAKDYLDYNIRCNSISPARVHTPFVDHYLKTNYPGKESEIYEQLAKTQPIGRMATPKEIANFAMYLCSEEAAFITGTDYPIDGGFVKLNS